MASHNKKSADKAALISSEDKARVEMLLIQVNSLVPAEQDVMKLQLKTFRESFLAACTVENVLLFAIEFLMDSCLESPSLCEKVAIVFGALSDVVIGQVKVRSVIINCLQNNYATFVSEGQHLQETHHNQYLNFIALFVAIFYHVRYPNGQRITLLAGFVICALRPLLSGEEAEFRLLAESVISNGQVLWEEAADELDKLLVDIRTTLIQRNLSSECRLWLLLTADVAEVNFGPLRAPILKFYKEHLGDSIEHTLNRGEKSRGVVIPDNATEETSTKATVSPKSPTSEKSPRKSERRQENVFPRSKDNLTDKVQGLRLNTSEKSQSFAGAIAHGGSKGKDHWGHDDRFSNTEYEAPRPRPDRSRGMKTPESPEKSGWSERPDRSRGKKTPETTEKSEWSERPERTKVPESNWRQPSNKDSKEKVAQLAPKILLPECDEVWD